VQNSGEGTAVADSPVVPDPCTNYFLGGLPGRPPIKICSEGVLSSTQPAGSGFNEAPVAFVASFGMGTFVFLDDFFILCPAFLPRCPTADESFVRHARAKKFIPCSGYFFGGGAWRTPPTKM
jgi:hypothetical protein